MKVYISHGTACHKAHHDAGTLTDPDREWSADPGNCPVLGKILVKPASEMPYTVVVHQCTKYVGDFLVDLKAASTLCEIGDRT